MQLGHQGKDAVQLLLINNARDDIKDKRGNTARELALVSGVDSVVAQFTNKSGQDFINDITKIE